MIVFWRDYTATAFGSATKQVRCESCGAEYVYFMTREVKGHAISWFFLANQWAEEEAYRRAEAKLPRALAGADPVPCPNCGHYQADMLWPARREKYRWMFWYVLVVLCSSPIWLLAALVFNAGPGARPRVPWPTLGWILGGILLGHVALLVIVRPLLRWMYNPNKEPLEQRLALGRSRASPLSPAGNPAPSEAS